MRVAESGTFLVLVTLGLLGCGCSIGNLFDPGGIESLSATEVGRTSGTPLLDAPPPELVTRLSLDTDFYRQHLDADGIPILASAQVSPFALAEARWIIENMLANREDLVAALASTPVRVTIMGVGEFTTDIPEHSDLQPAAYWNRLARGHGATNEKPAVSAGEENLLKLDGDPYATESILIHEFGHAIHEQGMKLLDPGFDTRLSVIFKQAIAEGLWQGTYAATDHAEYFAKGVQSWFDTNRENDSEHNHVNTREELIDYDPRLATLLGELFADNAWRYRPPGVRKRVVTHLEGFDRASAPSFTWPPELASIDVSKRPSLISVPFENRVYEE